LTGALNGRGGELQPILNKTYKEKIKLIIMKKNPT
jgi:hypothetical protein